MRTLIKIGLGMMMLAIVLTGACYEVLRAQGLGDHYAGTSRALTSEVRKMGDGILVVDLNGPIDLTLKQGAIPNLIVYAEQRMLPRIKTVQEGNTLHIHTTNVFFYGAQPLRVELTLPALQQLTAHGSGNSIVGGFSGDKLALTMNGSGDVRFNGRYQHVDAGVFGSGDLQLALGDNDDLDLNLVGSGSISASGQSKALNAHILGSGDLDAEKLKAGAVNVELLGSGDTTVFATQAAILHIKGSGDINVHGNPARREVNRSGSGDINWEND